MADRKSEVIRLIAVINLKHFFVHLYFHGMKVLKAITSQMFQLKNVSFLENTRLLFYLLLSNCKALLVVKINFIRA